MDFYSDQLLCLDLGRFFSISEMGKLRLREAVWFTQCLMASRLGPGFEPGNLGLRIYAFKHSTLLSPLRNRKLRSRRALGYSKHKMTARHPLAGPTLLSSTTVGSACPWTKSPAFFPLETPEPTVLTYVCFGRVLQQAAAIKVIQLKAESHKTIHLVQDWVFGIEFSINFHIYFTLSFSLLEGGEVFFLITQTLSLSPYFLLRASLQRICYNWLIRRYWFQGQSSEIFL